MNILDDRRERSAAKKIITRCEDGTTIWRYETAAERLAQAIFGDEKKKNDR